MEALARLLENIKCSILGERASQDAVAPVSQSLLGFIDFLGMLFGVDPNDFSYDPTDENAPYQNNEDDDHGHDGAGDASGDLLFNGIRASGEASHVWEEYQRRMRTESGGRAPHVAHISPVDHEGAVITSGRGPRDGRTHHGLDIDIPGDGRPNIVASADGVVLLARNFPQRADGSTNFGNTVIIGHADGTYTVYAHLRSIDSDIRPGVLVNQNDIIGVMGNSGGRVRTHLHYEQREGRNSREPRIEGREGGQLTDLAATGVRYESGDAQVTLDAFIESLRRSGALSPIQR